MDLVSLKQRFGVIGNSELLNRALEVAVRVAPTDLSVLVTGESGVGKEFFPQIIHAYSARKHNKYIAVNCGAIPEGTIDSELFGHEKGSFTGAVEARKGYFEEADGGTIFLDEVAELPLSTQVRLLRVLQTGEFMRVGSARVQRTDVRVVAATNMNLQEAIEKGRFREDLYYRLNTVPSRCRRCATGARTSSCCSANSPPTWPYSIVCRPSRSTTRRAGCWRATTGAATSAS